MERKKLVVLSGSGASAESGIATFRDNGGLWENHRVEEVATPEAWQTDPLKVLRFYNDRRRQAKTAKPNRVHTALAELEQHFEVTIITQNVDNLHEQAGSTDVLHLHGELFKARSTANAQLVYEVKGTELNWGDTCELGSQLRPHIVWFGEMVPMLEPAIEITSRADIFIVVGTSLQVYTAASLVNYVPENAPIFVIDPQIPEVSPRPNLHLFAEKGSVGIEKVVKQLLDKY